jgi:HPt (histidine-containing phosphotransfer) domain-containing protein
VNDASTEAALPGEDRCNWQEDSTEIAEESGTSSHSQIGIEDRLKKFDMLAPQGLTIDTFQAQEAEEDVSETMTPSMELPPEQELEQEEAESEEVLDRETEPAQSQEPQFTQEVDPEHLNPVEPELEDERDLEPEQSQGAVQAVAKEPQSAGKEELEHLEELKQEEVQESEEEEIQELEQEELQEQEHADSLDPDEGEVQEPAEPEDSQPALEEEQQPLPEPEINVKGLVFDSETAKSHFNGDCELLFDVAGLFLEQFPKKLMEMTEAIEQKDGQKLMTTAETIKSSARAIGAERIASVTQYLRIMGHRGELTYAGKVCTHLEQEVEELNKALETFIEELQPQNAK